MKEATPKTPQGATDAAAEEIRELDEFELQAMTKVAGIVKLTGATPIDAALALLAALMREIDALAKPKIARPTKVLRELEEQNERFEAVLNRLEGAIR